MANYASAVSEAARADLDFGIAVMGRARSLARAGLIGLFIGGASTAASPPLPTPCLAGNCGTSAQAFVSYGKAGATVTGTTMTITESSANAILNWANFNIAGGYKVNILQPTTTSQILNNIWSSSPTSIAGALTANGQVYLYNQNGIIFDKGAQIDVGSLTASTLNFSPVSNQSDPDYLFEAGILSNVSNSTFAGTLAPVFQAAMGPNGVNYAGQVTVEPGAALSAASGGRIMLLGSAVTNSGSITTPNGQTILGAGNLVYLAASSDASLRGLLIEVNAGGLGSTVTDPVTGQTSAVGTVTNTGLGAIRADTGNITLAGLVVNQQGRLTATTSVSENGSIFLVAGDTSAVSSSGAPEPYYDAAEPGFGALLPNKGGQLTLAAGSQTEVLSSTSDDPGDTSTISEANLASGTFLPSNVNMVGQSVAMLGNSLVRAPGGVVSVNAAGNPSNQFTAPTFTTDDGGVIYLGTGSTIDVSGELNVPVAATRNVIQVTLEGDDLQDDPLLRDGFLHGQAVTINANQGSSLFNVAPYVGNIGIGINEVLTAAGRINLDSDGAVIARAGSSMNVSGGSVAFQGGFGSSTTLLMGANGQVYNIATAPSTVRYVGLANSYSYTDPTWGTTTSINPQTYYAGYIQGNSAGTVSIQGPQLYLAGSMSATTVAGPYQRTLSAAAPTSPLSSANYVPDGGTFVLGCDSCSQGANRDYHAPAVVLANGATDDLGADFDYSATDLELPATLTLSPSLLTGGGFDRITIYSNGNVTLPQGTNIDLAAGGSLTVNTDDSINVFGNIYGSGASVDLETKPIVANDDPVSHNIQIGAGTTIDVSGSWINDSPIINSAAGTAPIASAGGKVTLSADGNLTLGAGSVIDVSGGGWINSGNVLAGGKAGSIALSADFRPTDLVPYVGTLSLGVGDKFIGDSLVAGGGGTLALTSGSVTVGSTPLQTPGELLLSPGLFANQGFSAYQIAGQNDVMIGGTGEKGSILIDPVQETWVLTGDPLLKPTGANVASFTQLQTLPVWQQAPVDVSFTTTGSSTGPGAPDSGNLVLGANASIVTVPGSSVSLVADSDSGNVDVFGNITALAGNILVQLESPTFVTNPVGTGLGYVPNQQILVGPGAVLNASAYSEVNTDNGTGYREGSVLPGGTISLQANKGYVVTDPSSTLNVSGVASTVDIVGVTGVIPTAVAGPAGSILIDAREGIVLQGALQGHAADVPGAAAGNLSIGLDLYDYEDTLTANGAQVLDNPFPTNPRTLTLSDQSPAALYTLVNGQPVLSSGVADISTQTISAGGFDNIMLKSSDIIAFDGAVDLASRASLILDAPLLQGTPGAAVQLQSAYVALGNYYNQSDYFLYGNPTNATINSPGCAAAPPCGASLAVDAQLIDIRGQSGLAGFSSEYLTSSGDIRLTSAENYYGLSTDPEFNGFLNTSGNLTLAAEQIYPTTNTAFTLASATAVTIAPATGASVTPLSAGGSLTIEAPSIVQEGVLRAPMGQITLQGIDTVGATGQVIPGSVTLAPGSLTSVSTNGTIIPYGSTVNGQQWTYSPSSAVTEVINVPPAKTITLNASNVSVGGANASVGTATIDLSGGGDLYAYEWIAGPGGSTDILNPASAANNAGVLPYQYAIVPSLGSRFAPIDAQYDWQQGSVPASAVSTPNATAQDIYISGVPGLAAGYYALLPARYALLPGAFAVQIVKANSDIAAGSAVAQPDGAYLIAGQLAVAGTDIISSRTSTVLIAPNSVVNTQSQYTGTYANAFFSSAATANQTATPSLPADAGELELAASVSLVLDGKIDFTTGSFVSGTAANGSSITQQGSGGQVSIQAPNIEIVDSGTPATAAASGVLQLNAQSLDNLGAQTLILGATAQNTSAGEQINGGLTQNIEVDNTKVALGAPQVILVAQNNISVDDDAQVIASGTLNQAPAALVLNGVGALLSASTVASVPVVSILAGQSAPPAATLSIGQQAHVGATQSTGGASTPGGSLLLYSTGNTTAQPDAEISASALGLYSSHVSMGDVPTGSSAPSGLNLTDQLLGTLRNIADLTIGSSSSIDFYGPLSLGAVTASGATLHSITLNAAAINGYQAGAPDNVTVTAGAITLENTSGAFAGTSGNGTGVLSLNAVAPGSADSGQITLGAGAKSISGFGGGVALNAAGDIEGQGTGASLSLAASSGAPVSLSLTGAALIAASGSDQTITASGPVTIGRSAPGKAVLPAPPLGGELVIEGSAIAQNGTIDLPAGIISLHASTGNVTLGGTSITQAAGTDQNFSVTDAVAPGGQISLASDQGSVTLARGAVVDVSGAASANGTANGSAGSLSVSAPEGQFLYAGSILKGGAPAGQLQGNFTLDVNSGLGGSGLSTLTDALQDGGFTGDLSLRTRSDAFVDLDDTAAHPNGIVASGFTLTADQGSIDVAGTIDTSGGNALNSSGGPIALWAQDNLTLEPSAQLLANAGAPGPVGINGTALAAQGGNITLGSAGGTIRLNGGTISMLGNGGGASDGTLTLRAPRTANDLGVQIQLPSSGGTVQVDTQKPIIVEGVEVYTASVLGDPSLGSLDITQDGNPGTPFGDALTFVGNGNGALLAATLQAAFSNNLGSASPVQVQVRPGIEIDAPLTNGSNGDLIVGDANTTMWDLNSWNAVLGVPVNLTLRAAGNLIFEASLSDGFTSAASQRGATSSIVGAGWTFGGSGVPTDTSGYDVTASYRLTAGADLSSANPLAVAAQSIASESAAEAAGLASGYLVAPHSGNLIVTPGYLIRTGDGNIDVAAGGDVLLGFNASASPGPGTPAYAYDSYSNLEIPVATAPLNSVIYTAGVPSLLSPADSLLFALSSGGGRSGFTASFGYDGGNVSVDAGADIQSVPSAEVGSDWLFRRGTTATNANGDIVLTAPNFNPAWGVEFDDFSQGIGALGGGNVALNAAGNIVNVSAVVPTTGRLLGAAGTAPSNTNLVVTGGGELTVNAGGNIESGVFQDDWGNAAINAGGQLTSGTTLANELSATAQSYISQSFQELAVYPVLLDGSGNFNVSARGGATINFVANGTVLPAASANTPGNLAYFYTYTPSSTLSVTSAGGDVVMLNNEENLPLNSNNPGYIATQSSDAIAYPSSVNLVAWSGNINIENTGLSLFPSATGNLKILSEGYITNTTTDPQVFDLSNTVLLTMNETNPALWPNPSLPQFGAVIPGAADSTVSLANALPSVPLHQDDSQPIDIVALTGSISPSEMIFPKAANVIAGGDIYDLEYYGKNLNPSDVTLIQAGGTISYSTPTVPITNALEQNDAGISLGGPGYLDVLAGNSINLGDSNGIQTTGSLSDVRLPSTGATVVVGAGFGNNSDGSFRSPTYQTFIAQYLAPDSAGKPAPYAGELTAYMQQLNPVVNADLSPAAALSAFQALTPAQQLPLIAQVLSDVLSATGLAHTTQGASYAPGYAAINALFPAADAKGNALTYQGDLNMYFSQVKTEQGGSINMLVPGGSVVVGVPNPPASLNAVKVDGNIPAAANLGVLVLGQGAIQGFADQDFDVNTSRMLTLEGGNIILWASNGNIDAGKGAKSASAAPPPTIQTDPHGNVVVNASNDVVGSGIGQLLSGPGETAGLVNLIAPKGDVNAGDAGIRVAGNLNIAAVQVIGAGNITVVGTSTGVPTSEAGAFAGALSGANSLGDASKNAVDQLSENLGNAASYQQLTDSLAPTFITVKMFCLGVECDVQ